MLLTNRRNALNWFSAFDASRNIFVHINEWDTFTNANPKCPIAYQIIENVLQFLMKLDINDPDNSNIHKTPKGCMNDFCNNKEEIILKLQTANICEKCIAKIHSAHIDHAIIEQAFRIFEGVRNELIFKKQVKFQHNAMLLPVTISKQHKIFVGNLEIRLTPLRKTLYLLFLKNKITNGNGILFNNLRDFKAELLAIYRKVTVSTEIELLDARINALVNPLGNTFSMEKSRISLKSDVS